MTTDSQGSGVDAATKREHPSILDAAQRNRAYPMGAERHFWSRGRCRIVRDKLPALASGQVVLDLGCGPGGMVEHLRADGIDCVGCDLARYEYAAEAALPHLHYETDAFELPADLKRNIHTVLLLDVLEHMEAPAPFIQRCVLEFPALEYVLVTMPARQELWSHFDDYYDHQLRYDEQSTRTLCGESGLEILDLGYWFHGLYGAVALSKWFGRERGVGVKPVTLHWAHDWLGYLFYLEEKLLPSRLPGSTIYALARVSRDP
ncbi:class I SAM-dependent methyltransferase [Myxococcota bacterium]|nr:class I SAM-dependent methyltransferase [Myxococcota bacterium]